MENLSVCNGKSPQNHAGITCNKCRGWLSPCLPFSTTLGFLTQGSFQLSSGTDNRVKSKVVSPSFTCHWGKSDAPSITSSFSCSGACTVIPLVLWRASSLSLCFTNNSQGVPWGFRGGWRFCGQQIALDALQAFLLGAYKASCQKLALQWEKQHQKATFMVLPGH